MYKRHVVVFVIEFTEEEYHKNPMNYPMVFDRAMFSEQWFDKKAEDGRYYLMNQTNTFPHSSTTDLANGDYIIKESGGWTYTMPKELFEMIDKEVDLPNGNLYV